MNVSRRKLGIGLLAMAGAGCAYSMPVTHFDRSAHPIRTVGVVSDSFPDIVMADQPRSASWVPVGNTVAIQDNTSNSMANAERFTAALATVGYDPEPVLRRSLQMHLAAVDVESINLDNVVRHKHLGLVNTTWSYTGEGPTVDAYLDILMVQWGFASRRDTDVMRPYFFFNAALRSPDGKQTLWSEVFQFNDINFAGIVTSMIIGDQSMEFTGPDELIANPRKAVGFLDASIDQIARELAGRLSA